MNNINIDEIKAKVSGFVEKYPMIDGALTKVADQAKFDKAYLAVAFTLLPVLLVFVIGYGHVVIDLAGFLYPMYASIKAIETTAKDDDTLWLSYWIIFCLFKVVEGAADFVISFIPFYFLIKLAFLIWCWNPRTKGAMLVYTSVVKPFIVPYILDSKKSE